MMKVLLPLHSFRDFVLVGFFKKTFRSWRLCGRWMKGLKAEEPRKLMLSLSVFAPELKQDVPQSPRLYSLNGFTGHKVTTCESLVKSCRFFDYKKGSSSEKSILYYCVIKKKHIAEFMFCLVLLSMPFLAVFRSFQDRREDYTFSLIAARK